MMKLKDRFTDRIFTLSGSIVLLCLVMAIIFPDKFPTVDNFSQLMLNLSVDTIVAVGMMVLMIAGMFAFPSDPWLLLQAVWRAT